MENIPRTHEGKIKLANWINNICIINVRFLDIEAQIREIQSKKKEIPAEPVTDKGVKLGEGGYFDSEIYESGKSKYDGYVTSIAANDDVDDDEEDVGFATKRTGLGAPVALLNDVAQVSTGVLELNFLLKMHS